MIAVTSKERLGVLLSGNTYREGVLGKADQRCIDVAANPCGICRIQDMVSITHDVSIAQAIAEICCPSGKIPAYLERKLAAMPMSA